MQWRKVAIAMAAVAVSGALVLAARLRMPRPMSRSAAEAVARRALALFGSPPNAPLTTSQHARPLWHPDEWWMTFAGGSGPDTYDMDVDAQTGQVVRYEDKDLIRRSQAGRFHRDPRGVMTPSDAQVAGAELLDRMGAPARYLEHEVLRTAHGRAVGRDTVAAIELHYVPEMPLGYMCRPYPHPGKPGCTITFDPIERRVTDFWAAWRYTISPVDVHLSAAQADVVATPVFEDWTKVQPLERWLRDDLLRPPGPDDNPDRNRSGVSLQYRAIDEVSTYFDGGPIAPPRPGIWMEGHPRYPYAMRLVYVVARPYREVLVDPATGRVVGLTDMETK